MYSYLPKNKLVAVVEINDPTRAEPLCKALLAGGVNAVEITLRTPSALEAVRAAAAAQTGIAVGAGTILSVADAQAALAAGAQFLVSPAATPAMLEAFAALLGVNKQRMIPGVASPSEAMLAYGMGFEVLKFFPAQASGGVPWLKAVAGPLPHIRFMPTGGVRQDTLLEFANLNTVAAVGGTWIAPAVDVANADWNAITAKAKAATALLG